MINKAAITKDSIVYIEKRPCKILCCKMSDVEDMVQIKMKIVPEQYRPQECYCNKFTDITKPTANDLVSKVEEKC